jgi:hypothetical protein
MSGRWTGSARARTIEVSLPRSARKAPQSSKPESRNQKAKPLPLTPDAITDLKPHKFAAERLQPG